MLWREPRQGEMPVRPLMIVVQPEASRRLFGRLAQLRGDFSPLSSWCHVLTPERFGRLGGLSREVELGGHEAAWIGLAIAEALLLADRSVSRLRLAACLATQTYAVARSIGLWPDVSISDVLGQYDQAQSLLKATEPSSSRLRGILEPIWRALSGLSQPSKSYVSGRGQEQALTGALRALAQSRKATEGATEEAKAANDAQSIYQELTGIPEAGLLLQLPSMTPELRVQAFDHLVRTLDDSGPNNGPSTHRNAIAFLAGYLATVAAGGSPSLGLTGDIARKWPEVTAWAYLVGSIGEQVIWTSGFDGLGRLVGRELTRPLRLDEAPTCDFSVDEALVLVDRKLDDPLVHLKIKQLRVVSVSLYPGANLSIAVLDAQQEVRQLTPAVQREQRLLVEGRSDKQVLSVLADALWPHLRPKIEGELSTNADAAERRGYRRPGRKTAAQTKLPLKY